ncbi:hypothetical protein ACA910_019726 [Epithemia clementina (nom. ined.)]
MLAVLDRVERTSLTPTSRFDSGAPHGGAFSTAASNKGKVSFGTTTLAGDPPDMARDLRPAETDFKFMFGTSTTASAPVFGSGGVSE